MITNAQVRILPGAPGKQVVTVATGTARSQSAIPITRGRGALMPDLGVGLVPCVTWLLPALEPARLRNARRHGTDAAERREHDDEQTMTILKKRIPRRRGEN